MASKSISVSPEAYQFIKGYADQNGLSLTEAASKVILDKRLSNTPSSEVEQVENPVSRDTAEIDAAMGYERKKDEVTARDGMAALFSTSRAKKTLGVDSS